MDAMPLKRVSQPCHCEERSDDRPSAQTGTRMGGRSDEAIPERELKIKRFV